MGKKAKTCVQRANAQGEFMKFAGIIAEYDPFHNGHEAHIEATRAALGADTGIICCMSGDFVQRGEAADELGLDYEQAKRLLRDHHL